MDGIGIIEKYKEAMGICCLEGKTGIKHLHQLCEDMGYREEMFANGDPLHVFLRDNPGAIEAIIDWISENMDDEWAEGLVIEDPIEDPVDEGEDD